MSYRKTKSVNTRRQGSTSMKKKKGAGAGKTVLFALIAVILLGMAGSSILGFVFSPSRDTCKEIIEDFQNSCNDLDANGILDCMKPSIAKPLKLALGIGSVVTSKSSDDMLGDILEALGGGMNGILEKTGLSIEDIFRSIELDPISFGFPGKTRKIKCNASIGVLEQKVYVYVTKQKGEPYISKISFTK